MAERTTVLTWRPLERHVQNDIPDSSQFLDSKTVLICAGPSKLNSIQGDPTFNAALPIGVMENFTLSQNKTIQRVFEIGSLLSYFVPGRMIGQVSFGRTLYNGASLLKVLYNSHTGEGLNSFRVLQPTGVRPLDIKSPPGVPGSDFYSNLGSDLFNHPFGILLCLVDNNLDFYGAAYLEDCHLQGHQLSINSQSTVLVEGASAQFDRAIPVTLPINSLSSRNSAAFNPNL